MRTLHTDPQSAGRERKRERGREGDRGRKRLTETDRENRGRKTGPSMGFWNFSAHPKWHTSPNEATPTPTRAVLLILLRW